MPDVHRRALLVTDDLFFAARILSVLRRLGFRADSAGTPEEALSKAADQPDLVIVSPASTRASGLDAVRRLKEGGARRIIAFVSHTRIPELRDPAREAGVDMLCASSAIVQRLPGIVERALTGAGEGSVR